MKKILFVEDSNVQRKMMIHLIREAGFTNEILEAADCMLAMEILIANCKDIGIILCDWHLPNMSGLEFIEAIASAAATKDVPVIMVTTECSPEKLAEAKKANPRMVDYIPKPYTIGLLKEKLAPYLTTESPMDQEMIRRLLSGALTESLANTFGVTLSLTTSLQDKEMFPDHEPLVVSTIGFIGELEGNISMCMPEHCACKLVSRMLGTKLVKVDNDVCDGLGEMVNMVIGGVKLKTVQSKLTFEIGVPNAVTGLSLRVISKSTQALQIVQHFLVKEDDIKGTLFLTYQLKKGQTAH
ncbi:MAG: response regulator [Candidatus Omnitrophica bacterium]|nr:response regulator [Candidatus Omnitrophota bacterium]